MPEAAYRAEKGGQRGQWPNQRAADEVHDGEDAAADALWARILRRKRSTAAAPRRGRCRRRSVTDCKPEGIGSEGAGDGGGSEQQQDELVHGLAANAVGELALEESSVLGGPSSWALPTQPSSAWFANFSFKMSGISEP